MKMIVFYILLLSLFSCKPTITIINKNQTDVDLTIMDTLDISGVCFQIDQPLNKNPFLTSENCGFNKKYYQRRLTKNAKKINATHIVVLQNPDSVKCTIEYYLRNKAQLID